MLQDFFEFGARRGLKTPESVENVKLFLGFKEIKGPIVYFVDGMADICQDINGGSAFSRCLNRKIPSRNCSF